MAKKSRKQSAKDIVKNVASGFKTNVKALGKGVKVVQDLASGDIIGAGKGIVDATKLSIKSNKVNKNIFKDLKNILFNHPEWYQNYPLEGLVNLNFGRRKGLYEEYFGQETASSDLNRMSIPSIASLDTYLFRPISETRDFEQAINFLYSTIRAANSGSVNYDPSDLAKYILDVRSIHALYADMRRTYAMLNDVSITDSTTPMIYFAAIGKDYDTFSANSANLREYANKLSIQISKLLPLDIDLIDRTRWMFSNLFKDSDDAKSSLVCFRLMSVTSCVDYTERPLSMNSVSGNVTGLTYDTYMLNVKQFVSTVVSDSTYMTIAGDILKAFGEEAIYPSEVWDNNMAVPKIYDEAALTQIQNATLSNFYDSNYTYGWSDIPDGLPYAGWPVCRYRESLNSVKPLAMLNRQYEKLTSTNPQSSIFYNLENQFVNAYKDTVTPGEVISFTRLKQGFTYQPGESSFGFETTVAGTEIVRNFNVYALDSSSTVNKYGIAVVSMYRFNQFTANVLSLAGPFMWSAIDYAPMIQDLNPVSTTATVISGAMWDFNNYARVTMDNLLTFHGYAVMSLLATDRLLRQSNARVISG